MNQDIAYWLTLANLPKWGPKKTISLIINFFHEQKLPVEDFFQLDEEVWRKDYGLGPDDIKDLLNARSEVANNAFLAESLLNEGYEVIPVTSPEYPATLKENLKS